MPNRSEVIAGVARQVEWWIDTRRQKLVTASHESMAVNPFLAPVLMGMHGFSQFEELAEFLLVSHLATGHSTGFGKLIDEKILPAVFGTQKLDRSFRRAVSPYGEPMFDEIDHVVRGGSASPDLLCLKASRWTIQLTMAVQLNASFSQIIQLRERQRVSFGSIALGVIYGKQEDLTDKFDIARGINRGQPHEVVDLTNDVYVWSGREFWSWLNDGEEDTQLWVLDGLLEGLRQALGRRGSFRDAAVAYQAAFTHGFVADRARDGSVDWHSVLRRVNG